VERLLQFSQHFLLKAVLFLPLHSLTQPPTPFTPLDLVLAWTSPLRSGHSAWVRPQQSLQGDGEK
jgi:hypothetical protein